MSEFSDSFRELIKEKDVNVYSMALYCNTDRSTMYKYISGKRKLKDISLFKKISEFMRLSPKEYQDFLRTYHITNIGEYTYYCRQNVENFILNFPENLIPPKPPEDSYGDLPDYFRKSPCFVLHSRVEINNYLYWMIHQESSASEGHLALLLQPDYEFLFHLLASIKPSRTPVQIEHIFCLNTSEQMTESKKIRNLLYMKKIMPLFFAGLDYHPYYFYDDINAHFYNLNTLPCLLLTSSCALMCSSDFKQGILYYDAEILAFLRKMYDNIKKKTSPLFHIVNSVLDECHTLGGMGWNLSPSYGIQAEPCLAPYITPEILERVMYKSLPMRDALMANIREFLAAAKSRIPSSHMHAYHTRQGVLHFLETGRLQEIPEEIYCPFNIQERFQMLENMLQYMSAGIYRMLKGPLENLPLNLHLSFTSYNGYILFRNHAGKNIYLIIEESSMLSAFMDYASNLDESYVCTPEETASFIREAMQKYKSGSTPHPNIRFYSSKPLQNP